MLIAAFDNLRKGPVKLNRKPPDSIEEILGLSLNAGRRLAEEQCQPCELLMDLRSVTGKPEHSTTSDMQQ